MVKIRKIIYSNKPILRTVSLITDLTKNLFRVMVAYLSETQQTIFEIIFEKFGIVGIYMTPIN